MLAGLFNPRADFLLCPGDLMYDLITGNGGSGLVFAQNTGQGWEITEHVPQVD